MIPCNTDRLVAREINHVKFLRMVKTIHQIKPSPKAEVERIGEGSHPRLPPVSPAPRGGRHPAGEPPLRRRRLEGRRKQPPLHPRAARPGAIFPTSTGLHFGIDVAREIERN